MIKFLELGCGVGNHVIKQSKIIKNKGLVLATDYSAKSLNLLKKNLKTKNIKTKCISMDSVAKYLKNKKSILIK